MRSTTLSLVLLAGLPLIIAQNSSSTSISYRCYTRMSTISVSSVPSYTGVGPTITQETTQIETYTPIATITPNATTTTSKFTTTTTSLTTVTHQDTPIQVPTANRFLNIEDTLAQVAPNPFGPKQKRAGRAEVGLPKRQSDDGSGSTAGLDIDSGTGALSQVHTESFPQEVFCVAYTYMLRTSVTTTTAATQYKTIPALIATAFTTTTVTETSTITQELPRATYYQACGPKNVGMYLRFLREASSTPSHMPHPHPNCNAVLRLSLSLFSLSRLAFPSPPAYPFSLLSVSTWYGKSIAHLEYFPRQNDTRQRILSAVSGYDCCASCQETPNCAGTSPLPPSLLSKLNLTPPGSAYYAGKCYISLTHAPVYLNATSTAAGGGIYPTGGYGQMVSGGISTPNGTVRSYCWHGSTMLKLGWAWTKELASPEKAFAISNGKCGSWYYNSNLHP